MSAFKKIEETNYIRDNEVVASVTVKYNEDDENAFIIGMEVRTGVGTGYICRACRFDYGFIYEEYRGFVEETVMFDDKEEIRYKKEKKVA